MVEILALVWPDSFLIDPRNKYSSFGLGICDEMGLQNLCLPFYLAFNCSKKEYQTIIFWSLQFYIQFLAFLIGLGDKL